MDPKERLEALKGAMKKAGIDAYYIPSSDFHASEYTNEYFKVREFFSGFTGSAADLLVTEREVLLWTDGRYFIQAEQELKGSGIRLMKSGEEGVPGLKEYLKKNLKKGDILGFDGRTVTASFGKELKKAVPSRGIKYKKDLTKGIFERPDFPSSGTEILRDDITGEGAENKINKLRSTLKRLSADGIFLSKLDEIAYIFNIRAADVAYTPVAMAYAYITSDRAYVFLANPGSDTGYEGAIIKPYDDVFDFIKSGSISGRVLLDEDSVSYSIYRLIKKKADTVDLPSPVELMKAVKNDTEIANIRDIYHKDSLALTRFIKEITTGDRDLTECSAADLLEGFRKQIPEYREPSFATISAYGENAAIVHYEPSPEHDRKIEDKGLYLVDSGGQYTGGTTDVTRTVVMGDLTREEKEAYTLTACGMLKVLYAKFIKGTPGESLDVLAREGMWQKGYDFRHGTGHGVGYMLSVHEGPQSIRRPGRKKPAELMPGMLISDEPGLYIEGSFGVRIENILLVIKDRETADGRFCGFESLTQVPIDDRGIDKSLMTSDDIERYVRYQREVIDSLKDDLTSDELGWLKEYSGINNKDSGE